MRDEVCGRCGYVGPVDLEGEWLSHTVDDCSRRKPNKPIPDDSRTSTEDVSKLMEQVASSWTDWDNRVASMFRPLPDDALQQIIEACAGHASPMHARVLSRAKVELAARARADGLKEMGAMFCPVHGCHSNRCPPHDDE